MAEEQGNDLHARYYEYLLDRIRADRYPSADMISIVEEGANEEGRAELFDILREKMLHERYPSVPMLRRMGRLAS